MLSEHLSLAVEFAADKHKAQTRKNGAPYICHLLQVSGIVVEMGGSTEAAIAALLHDTLEDTDTSKEEILKVSDPYGPMVLALVEAVSENKALPKTERKALYVKQIASLSTSYEEVAKVSFADKLSNLYSYLVDNLWDEETNQFYTNLIDVYELYVEPNWLNHMKSLLELVNQHTD